MDTKTLSAAEFLEVATSPFACQGLAEEAPGAVVVVNLTGAPDQCDLDGIVRRLATLPHPLIGILPQVPASGMPQLAAVMDVLLSDQDSEPPGTGTVEAPDDLDDGLALVVDAVAHQPLAAAALVLLLRGGDRRSVEHGLIAESAVYSVLQAGPEFAAWKASRTPRPRPVETDPAVRVSRPDGRLRITLSRPRVHNALDIRMRDALVEALTLAAVEAESTIVLDGDGPSFCSGGDLNEFGTAPDPATAHIVRLARSPALAMAAVGDRVEAHLHGACFGAGIELPAFARRVLCRPDTSFALPELALGLIPGSGGSVSLPRRIGRHRTAWLALTGERIDAERARRWGLVDEISA